MTSDEVADEVEYLQGRVTADMIKSYCGRGSQSLRGNSLPDFFEASLSMRRPQGLMGTIAQLSIF